MRLEEPERSVSAQNTARSVLADQPNLRTPTRGTRFVARRNARWIHLPNTAPLAERIMWHTALGGNPRRAAKRALENSLKGR